MTNQISYEDALAEYSSAKAASESVRAYAVAIRDVVNAHQEPPTIADGLISGFPPVTSAILDIMIAEIDGCRCAAESADILDKAYALDAAEAYASSAEREAAIVAAVAATDAALATATATLAERRCSRSMGWE